MVKEAQIAMLKLGVKPRMHDDPKRKRDREKFPQIDFDNIAWSSNGFSRHVFHAFKEMACDFLLYVIIYLFIA